MRFASLHHFGMLGKGGGAIELPFPSSSILQRLFETTDGANVEDSVSPLVADPEPIYTDVPVLSFNGSDQYGLALCNVAPVKPIRITVRIKTDVTIGAAFPFGLWGFRQGFTDWASLLYFDGGFIFQYLGTQIDTAHTGIDDGEWHTIVVELGGNKIIGDQIYNLYFDGNLIQSSEITFSETGTLTSFLLGLSGFGGAYGNWYWDGEYSLAEIDYDFENPSQTESLFQCHCITGVGDCIPSTREGLYAQPINLVLGSGTADDVWIPDEPGAVESLLNGHLPVLGFNGVTDQLWYNGPISTNLDEIEFKVYVTGKTQQVVLSFIGNLGQYSVQINAPGGGAVRIVYYLAGSISTDLSSIVSGWHTFKFVATGGTPGYDIYIDGQLESATGISSVIPLTAFGTAANNQAHPGPAFDYCWIKYTDSTQRYLIKDGVIDCSLIGDIDDWQIEGTTRTAYPPKVGDPVTQDGGQPQNYSIASVIQQSNAIVDALIVSNPSFGGGQLYVLSKISDVTWRGTVDGVQTDIFRALGNTVWRIQRGIPTYDDPRDGPVPPSGDWAIGGWTVYHGYEGSFWADTEGEFVARAREELVGHQAGALNTFMQHEANDNGFCLIDTIESVSLEERITVDMFADINTWQGDSGCVPLSTYAVDDLNDPLLTTNGSLIIIGI